MHKYEPPMPTAFSGVRVRAFSEVDALVVPTTPTIYTIAAVANDPIALNTRLGTYTNFEPYGLEGARDITEYGGWRAFLAASGATRY